MKSVILVGDGMGDYPVAELGDKTVLEAAHTPAMDDLASRGRVGRLRTVPDGMAPGSDVANLSLLGYRPEEFYTGRSPLEAASLGVDLGPNEIAFRLNLVHTREEGGRLTMVDYSGGHISTLEAHELIAALQDALPLSGNLALYPGIDYRHLLVYRGPVDSLTTAPPHDYSDQDVTDFWQAYAAVPELAAFNRAAGPILAAHPVNKERQAAGKRSANNVWLWGEGMAPAIVPLKERFGVSGALISAVDLLKGIAVYAGMEVVEVAGATGYLDTNYEGKVSGALAALKRHDLVFVHVEAPDETGHQGLVAEKVRAVEDFDARVVAPVAAGLAELGEPYRLVVCMDHFTPLALRTHTDDEVPLVIFASEAEGEGSGQGYDEAAGRASDLVFANGQEFMAAVLD
ncbi:MAG: cofactor-independent phosphoglycerate mutase [Thermodesulfobacteriota bacterium]